MAATTTIGGLTAVTDGNLTGAALAEVQDAAGNSAKSTLAQLRTNLLAGGTGFTATDPLVIGTLNGSAPVIYPVLTGETGVANTLYPYWDVRRFGVAAGVVTSQHILINNAFTSLAALGGGNVVVPGVLGVVIIDADFNTGKSIRLQSNTRLVVEAGAELRALTNSLTNYAVVYGANLSNVSVVGPGTIRGERTTHTGGTGEAGMGIQLLTCSNVRVEGVTCADTWGDGIYLGYATSATAGQECSDVVISNVTVNNCRRNGMSVVAGKRVRVVGSTFTNTNGTNPQAGIDFEPDVGSAVVDDCTVSGCTFDSNTNYGVACAGASSQITISGSNTFRNNGFWDVLVGNATVDVVVANNIIVHSHTVTGAASPGDTSSGGIYCAFNRGAIISDNIVRGSFDVGVWARGGADPVNVGHNTITGNKVIGDGTATNYAGILASNAAEQSIIDDNSATSCAGGILVSNSSHCVITNNKAWLCRGHGIQVDGSGIAPGFGNRIANNQSYANGAVAGSGFLVSFQNYATLIGNNAEGNGQNGINISNSPDCLLEANTVVGNSQQTNNTYDNISIGTGCDRSVLAHNITRKGTGANQARAGIVNNSAGNVRLWFNDTENGGATWEIRDFLLGTTGLRQFGDRGTGQVNEVGDASLTITRFSAQTQTFTTALTANRTLTLPPVNDFSACYPGMRFRVTRPATGAFNMTVQDSTAAAIKVLTAGQWVEVTVNAAGNAWVETGFGSL